MDFVSSFTNQVVQKALDGHWQRHTAISSNMANVETPNYKRQKVSFENQLAGAIRKHRESGMGPRSASNDDALPMKASGYGHFKIDNVPDNVVDVEILNEQESNFEVRSDGNSVDVEREMVELAQNTQRYIALNNFQGRFFRNMRNLMNDIGQV